VRGVGGRAGVLLDGCESASIERSDVSRNAGSGLVIVGATTVHAVTECTFVANSRAGVLIGAKAAAAAPSPDRRGRAASPRANRPPPSAPTIGSIVGCQMDENDGAGLIVRAAGAAGDTCPRVEANSIRGNGDGGVRLGPRISNVRGLQRNTVAENLACGVEASGVDDAVLAADIVGTNTIAGHNEADVVTKYRETSAATGVTTTAIPMLGYTIERGGGSPARKTTPNASPRRPPPAAAKGKQSPARRGLRSKLRGKAPAEEKEQWG